MRTPLEALLGLLLVACIAPGPIDERPDQNRPPVVVGEIQPREARVLVSRLSGDVSFSLDLGTAIVDPDGDRLFAYWYVAFDGQFPHPPDAQGDPQTLLACSDPNNIGAFSPHLGPVALEDDTEITLVAFVSDREIDNQNRFPEEAFVIRFVWIVELRDTCPKTAP